MMNLKDKYNSIAFLITILILTFLFIIISSPTNYLDSIRNNYKSPNNDFDSNNFSQIKRADYWNLTGNPISIDGDASGVGAHNWTWAVSQSWCRGSGNSTDPYIIENITMDCLGTGNGIEIRDSLNYYFIIRNCTIIHAGDSGYNAGISIFNVRNGTIIGNNCSFNKNHGIYANICSNNNISANILTKNSMYGIYLSVCINFTISLNNFTGCGIYLGWALPEYYYVHKIDTDNYINGKKAYYYVNQSYLNSNNFTNAGQIILINCNNSNIDNQNFTLGSVGILLHSCNNNTISNLIISNHTLYGIRLRISDYNNLTNITLMNMDSGIYLEANSTNNIIKNNTISNCIYGIYLKDKSNFNNLTDNKLYNNDEGFHLGLSVNTTISNNTLEFGMYGIHLINSNYSTILDNNIAEFDESGIYSEFSYENKVIGNVLFNNDVNGIILSASHSNNISENEIYNNDCGIYLKLSNYNILGNNNVNYNNIGIYLESSNSTYVIDNTLIGNSVCIDDDDNCKDNTFINNRCISIQEGDDDSEKKENIYVDNILLIVGIGFGIGALIIVSGLSIFHLSRKKGFSLKVPFQKSKKIKSSKEILAGLDIIELSELFSKEGVPEALVFLRDIDLTLISKEFMKKVDKLRFDEKDKVKFLKEILYFSSKERDAIVSDLLKMSKHTKRIK